MVIICPIGWGMAQRGESKHKERFVQRQRNARPNKGELALPCPLVVPLRVPLLVIFQVSFERLEWNKFGAHLALLFGHTNSRLAAG